MNELIRERAKYITEPKEMGSYKKEDCIFLLKDISDSVQEKTNEEREKAIQSGIHYSEMLPIEYMPKENYIQLFHDTLKETSKKLADIIATVSEIIYKKKGNDVILVSLARAGTPIGVLIKRYILHKYKVDVPHYSISIIRDKGIDKNALTYIINKHQSNNLQFIDGWTGKGVINDVLVQYCKEFEDEFGVEIDSTMAVLADPSYCVQMYGTREDFLIPSACLNSTVSGLMSRTFLNDSMFNEYDFHGAKFYKEYLEHDLSNYYIDEVSKHFNNAIVNEDIHIDNYTPNLGLQEVYRFQKEFDITNVNFIKPGVGETTRVLLRRIPDSILVNDIHNPNLQHVILLARERNVPIIEYPNMHYSCCGIIKVLDQ